LYVSPAITDQEAAAEVDLVVCGCLQEKAGSGLAAATTVAVVVAAYPDGIQCNLLPEAGVDGVERRRL
jgi:hypothetical protein